MLYLPSAFSKITTRLFFERLLSTRVANVARVALSQTSSGWRASFFGPILDIWNSFFWCSNHRNSRSKSGLCCRVRPSFLHIDAVVSACTFPRPLDVVDYNQFYTARISGKIWRSRFTLGDNVKHVCDSFQCSRTLHTFARLFLLVSSISVHGSGRV